MSETSLRNASIDAALNEVKEAYVTGNPNSLARYVEATGVMPGGNTRTVLHYAPFPLAMTRAAGCRMWDADGHEFVDFLGEYTAGLYGHSHPVIRAALDKALDSGISYGASNMTEVRFARAVCERFGLERVRFTNSGTEANLLAISLARIYTRRPKVMVFNGGYHGAVFGFAGGGSPINAPFDYVLATYNDIEATRTLIAEHAAALALVILEPMIGSGGCVPASHDFLHMLRAETERVGALLVLDEVMTSRLAPGGLQSVIGVKPDLTTFGKYIGGGMSFGAFGGRAEIMDLFDPRRSDALPHAGTFNNNILTMSAGLAGLTDVYTADAARALNARGDALRERLNGLCKAAGAAMQFTGIGSMLAVHFTTAPIRNPADAAKADQKLKELFFFDMLAHGIWLARRGMMTLCLPIGDAECDKLAAAVQEFLEARRSLL
ncbi:MAG TPA: aminotransferase class III-fold pyridoxal phosphate-dependent enzyme [Rhodopila sp.]|uniref:aspartate aminotransferase family protein n=1 Tax=Rhodopila sp. TaxID=2480087 RepID=UPI002BD8A76A|nr:aminotransferase class III-fold pyridoxal phosphate-dependent enzyme [Rhodopila sp.]HVY13699.1 aminotransferase class III-fold pyridoxal phosphate-dependent enzyme [Rhodopila sp.]